MLTITANDFRKEFDRHLAGEEPLLITTDDGKPLFVALSRNEYILMHGYTDLLRYHTRKNKQRKVYAVEELPQESRESILLNYARKRGVTSS